MRLEEILSQIEGGNMDIDRLTGQLAQAQELVAFCRKRLYSVEEDIKEIQEGV